LIKSLKPIQIRNSWNSRSRLNWKAQFSTNLILNYEIKNKYKMFAKVKKIIIKKTKTMLYK
jgi:hypothetical protein